MQRGENLWYRPVLENWTKQGDEDLERRDIDLERCEREKEKWQEEAEGNCIGP